MTGLALNLAVFAEGPHESQPMFQHTHVQQQRPVVPMHAIAPAKPVPNYVPAAKELEAKHVAREQARHAAEMENAHTNEEKQAVKPMAKYTPPSPEALMAAEEEQEEKYTKAVEHSFVGTWHAEGDHDAMLKHLEHIDIVKADRQMEKAKAKHAAAHGAAKE